MASTTLKDCRHATCSCHAGADAGGWSRRRMLGGIAAGALVAATPLASLFPKAARAEDDLGPQAALDRLMDGNARFVDRRLTLLDKDLAILREKTVAKQRPFASVLSCADSRVPVELMFDQSIGQIFVNRVAGNIATPEIIASIEYGVAVLGTPVLMVLGHTGCGAVQAAMAAKLAPGKITSLYRYIKPAIARADGDLEKTIKANAQVQAKTLKDSSVVVAAAVAAGTLKLVAGYYDLASGKVTVLG
ncbi:MAG: carbonic anhydrase [Candidatus Eiseniibacteriota bacterium]